MQQVNSEDGCLLNKHGKFRDEMYQAVIVIHYFDITV